MSASKSNSRSSTTSIKFDLGSSTSNFDPDAVLGSRGAQKKPLGREDFGDLFGGSPKSKENSIDFDSMFSQGLKSSSSVPVDDKPVYDDDIFQCLPGVKSFGSSLSSKKYGDEFESVPISVSSPPSRKDGGSSAFDDLLGGFGKAESQSKNRSSTKEEDSSVPDFDDLIPGFGGSSPSGERDPVPNRKHLAMLERLSNRNQSLPSKPNSSSFESTAAFLSQFAELKNSIESNLSQCRDTDPTQIKTQLDAISRSIADLEKLVAESSYYLPSYEVRSSLKTISDLKQSLESLIPKKKFSFKSKAAKKAPISALDVNSQPEISDCQPPPPPPSYTLSDSPGFRNRVGELLVKDFRGSEVGEFSITDLQSCEVRLLGSARTLFVHRLRDCKIFAGPVTGSILIEEAENCLFVLASHQIRIHNATACRFYLRVRSRPIIEDCLDVSFAPYCLSYDGIENDLMDSNLAVETGNWAMVDDFKWLKNVQSPNWSVLPENKRIEGIDISTKDMDLK